MIQHSFGQYSVWFSKVLDRTHYNSAQFRTALSMTDLEALYMSRCCLGLHPVLLSSIQYHSLLHRTALTPWKILLFLWLYMFNFLILCSSTGAVQNCTLLWKKIWPWKLTHLITWNFIINFHFFFLARTKINKINQKSNLFLMKKFLLHFTVVIVLAYKMTDTIKYITNRNVIFDLIWYKKQAHAKT